MGLLDGKRLLITGVLTEASLGYGVAKLAQAEGAEIILTGVGNGMKHTGEDGPEARSPSPRCSSSTSPTRPTSTASAASCRSGGARVDGALHSIGFAPPVCLGGTFMDAGWDDVAVAMNVSAYSLKALADIVAPLMTDGGSIVGLDFDNTVT